MKHARADYNAIQPFPVQRRRMAIIDGQKVEVGDEHLGKHMDPIIPDDEPVFLIRAQDRAAIPAAEAWCVEAERIGADDAIVSAVRRHIEVVREWQATHLTKVPDAPAGVL